MSDIMLSTTYTDNQECVYYVKYCYIECHYAGYHYAESRNTEWHYEAHLRLIVVIKSIKLSVTVLRVIILSVIILSVVAQNVTSSFFPKRQEPANALYYETFYGRNFCHIIIG